MKIGEVMRCARCGAETVRRAYAQKYCPGCTRVMKNAKNHEHYSKRLEKNDPPEELPEEEAVPKPSEKHPPKLSIVQIAALARAAGMSYGQYVSRTEQK